MVREIEAQLVRAAWNPTNPGAPVECKAGAESEVANVGFRAKIRSQSDARFDIRNHVPETARSREAQSQSDIREIEWPAKSANHLAVGFGGARGGRVRIENVSLGLHTRQARREVCRTARAPRSEEHTSELQSRLHLVCRLLLEKKNKS